MNKRIIIIGSGTGGHIFPGLAVAVYLMQYGWKVRWIGTSDSIESFLVPKYGIDIDCISIRKLCRVSMKVRLSILIDIFRSWNKARKIIINWKPNVVLGMGGYISGPSCLAAWSCGIPLLIHEQNSVAGLTNKILSKIANKSLQGFPHALSYADTVGNPIRSSLLNIPDPEIRWSHRTGPIRVLVIGGSQGSKILNRIMPIVAARLSGAITLWHQVGIGALENMEKYYYLIGENNKNHKIIEFIENIEVSYSWADIVVCQAGAMTVSELSAVGLPALFIPFIHKDYHQYQNAKLLERIGAAKIIEQSLLTVENITNIFMKLNREVLITMAKRAKENYFSNATERIAQEVVQLSYSNL